jgi:hypothetical protein
MLAVQEWQQGEIVKLKSRYGRSPCNSVSYDTTEWERLKKFNKKCFQIGLK